MFPITFLYDYDKNGRNLICMTFENNLIDIKKTSDVQTKKEHDA